MATKRPDPSAEEAAALEAQLEAEGLGALKHGRAAKRTAWRREDLLARAASALPAAEPGEPGPTPGDIVRNAPGGRRAEKRYANARELAAAVVRAAEAELAGSMVAPDGQAPGDALATRVERWRSALAPNPRDALRRRAHRALAELAAISREAAELPFTDRTDRFLAFVAPIGAEVAERRDLTWIEPDDEPEGRGRWVKMADTYFYGFGPMRHHRGLVPMGAFGSDRQLALAYLLISPEALREHCEREVAALAAAKRTDPKKRDAKKALRRATVGAVIEAEKKAIEVARARHGVLRAARDKAGEGVKPREIRGQAPPKKNRNKARPG